MTSSNEYTFCGMICSNQGSNGTTRFSGPIPAGSVHFGLPGQDCNTQPFTIQGSGCVPVWCDPSRRENAVVAPRPFAKILVGTFCPESMNLVQRKFGHRCLYFTTKSPQS
jgi:hypothetical protein